MISVLILTRNEERDLPGCLRSVSWSDDVHVFDSHSTDRTAEIAEAAGARVSSRVFDNYAAQRNAALATSPFRHDWVLMLDADERVPEPLAVELLAFVSSRPAEAAARIRRRDFLWGTWLRHAQLSPWYIRLVRPGRVRFERAVNEVIRVDGAIRNLSEPFDHHPFSKGLAHWFARHNTYSSMEAEQLLEVARNTGTVSVRKAIFGKDFNERRVHQKQLFYRMPLRPAIKFLYLYVYRGGFLDGRAGFTYSTLQGVYEYMISLKARELRRQRP